MLTFALLAHASASDATPLLDELKQRFQTKPLTLGVVIRALARVETELEAGETNGFSIGTARFRVKGQLDEGFSYFFMADIAGSPALLDAKVGWDNKSGHIGVSAGYFKVPFSAEFLLPIEAIDFVSRAPIVGALAPNRDFGAEVHGKANVFRWAVGVFNGNRSPINDGGVLLAARAGVQGGGEDVTVSVHGNVAYSDDAAVSFLGSPVFAGRRLLYGGDATLSVRAVTVSTELIAARSVSDAGDERAPLGGHGTLSGRLPLATQDIRLIGRWDFTDLDAGDPMAHRALAAVIWTPTPPVQVQANLIVPLTPYDAGDIGALGNLQLAF